LRPRFAAEDLAVVVPEIGSNLEVRLAALGDDAWNALCRHWADRGWTADGLPPAAPLLGPLRLPPTLRGQAKATLPLAGYSASGLDRLLRAAWRDFVALPEHADHRAVRFTPRMLARVQSGEP